MTDSSGPPPSGKRKRRDYGSPLMQTIDRRLHSKDKHDRYIEPELLAQALEESYLKQPLPLAIQTYLCQFLRGKIKKPKGRRPSLMERERNNLICFYYPIFLDWLNSPDRVERPGFSEFLTKEAEGLPHYEQAAHMTVEALRQDGRYPAVDYQQVIKYASSFTRKAIEDAEAFLRRRLASEKSQDSETS